MKAFNTIYAAVTAFTGARPHSVEIGYRPPMNAAPGTPYTCDSRLWDWEDSEADVDIRDWKTVRAGDVEAGTELDAYVYRRVGSFQFWEIELDTNVTVTRTADGWIASE